MMLFSHKYYRMVRGLALFATLITALCAAQRGDANVTVIEVAPLTAFQTQQQRYTNSLYKCTFTDDTATIAAVTLIPSLVGRHDGSIKISNSLHEVTSEPATNATGCLIKGPTTCLTNISHPQLTVYVSITMNMETSYSISFSLPTLNNQMEVEGTYMDSFEREQVSVYEVDLGKLSDYDEVEQLTLIMRYTNLDSSIQRKAFKALAALGSLPNWSSQAPLIQSKAAGINTQVLILLVPSNYSKYYVTISSPNNNPINSHIIVSRPSSLSVNQAVTHNTVNKVEYISQVPDQDANLSLEMAIYGGEGTITVQYCDQIIVWSYFGRQGLTGVIEISQQLVQKCTQLRSKSSKQINNTLKTTVFTANSLTYFLGFYQHAKPEQQVHPGMQLFSILTYQNSTHNHTLLVEPGPNYILTAQLQEAKNHNTNATMTVTRYICSVDGQQNCTEQSTVSSKNGLFLINKLNSNNYCYVVVTVDEWSDDPETILLYKLALEQFSPTIYLQADQVVSQEVVKRNQGRCYEIDLKQLYYKNNWQSKQVKIVVQMGVINGYASVRASTSTVCAFIENQAIGEPDTAFGISGQLTMNVFPNMTTVNIAVKGLETSVYDISFSASVSGQFQLDIITLTDNEAITVQPNQQNFSVLYYNAHILPYVLEFSLAPQCFRYGPSPQLIGEDCIPFSKNLELTLMDLYINITHTQSTLVEVTTPQYTLHHDNPLWINCAFYCWTQVFVFIQEPVTIVQKGDGKVIYESTYYVEDSLEISCDSYPCMKTLNATVEQSSIYLWLKSQNIVMAETESTTINFKQYQELIYPVKPWKEHNSILVLTHSHKVKASYQVVPNLLLQNNVQVVTFLHSHNTKSIQGTALKNNFVLEIPHNQLDEMNCIQNNKVRCIVTLFLEPDYSMPYDSSASSITGTISANGYRQSFTLNNLQQMAETTGPSLIYFSHRLTPNLTQIAPQYVLTINTLSPCAPAIYQATQSLNYDTPVFNRAVLTPLDQWLNFTLLNDRACLFQLFVSSSSMSHVIANTLYSLQPTQDLTVNLIFRNEGTVYSNFTVIYKDSQGQNASNILVNKVSKSGNYVIPSVTDSDFRVDNSNRLTVQTELTEQFYVIVIVVPDQRVFELMIRTQGAVVIKNGQKFYGGEWVMQDQETKRIESYKLWIMSSWVMMVASSSTIEMQVYDYQSKEVSHEAVLNGQQDSLSFTPVESLTTYQINITTLSVLREDNYYLQFYDTSLVPLFDGIVMNGVLMHLLDMRCYLYRSSDSAQQDSNIKVTLIYERVKCQSVFLQIQVGGVQFLSKIINFDSTFVSEFTIPFWSSTNYQICFQANNIESAGQPYRLILQHSVDAPTLLPSSTLTSSLYPQKLSQYKLLHPTEAPVLITIIPCQEQQNQEYQLASYKSYQQMREDNRDQSSKETVIKTGSVYAKMNPNALQGYLYLAVESPHQLPYQIKNQLIPQVEPIRASQWDLPDTIINKISINHKGQVEVVLPPVKQVTNTSDLSTVTYTAYLLDLAKYSDHITIDMQARCPQLGSYSSSLHEETAQRGLWTQAITQTDIKPQKLTTPTLIFPTILPDRYNITGKVTIITHGQTIEHFYSISTNMDSSDSSQGHSNPFYFSILLVIIIAVCALVFLFRRIRSQNLQERTQKQSQGIIDETGRSVQMKVNATKQARKDVNVDLLGGEQVQSAHKKGSKLGYQQMIEQL